MYGVCYKMTNYSHAVKTRGARGGSSLPLHAAKTSFSNVADPWTWPASNMLVYSYSDTIGKVLLELASIHASSDSMLHSHVRTSNGKASTKGVRFAYPCRTIENTPFNIWQVMMVRLTLSAKIHARHGLMLLGN